MDDYGPRDRPPARAERLLRRLVRARSSAPFIVGDLREEFEAIQKRHGRLLGACWYWFQVLSFGAPGRRSERERTRRARRPIASSTTGFPSPATPTSGRHLMLDSLTGDLRFGLRSLARRPGLSIAAGLILAIAIGATTAIFSVVDGVLLKPLPFPEPDRIVRLGWSWASGGADALSWLKLSFWQENNESFEAVASYRTRTVELGDADASAREIVALTTSAGFLEVLGVSPALGRSFVPEEDRPGGPRAVILGDALWREHFDSDPAAIGKTLRIGAAAWVVVGVLPPGFEVPTLEGLTDLLIPLRLEPAPEDRGHNYPVIARLRPDIEIEQARANEALVAERFAAAYPGRVADGEGIRLMGFLDPYIRADARTVLWVLAGAVGLVLLIACANVANLMLLGATARRRELAARAALGASRWLLVRQLLVESMMLAMLASAGGIFLAHFGLDALLAIVPQNLPRLDDVGLDLRVLTTTLALTVGTGIFFGTAAALPATRGDLRDVLHEGGRGASSGHSHRRLRTLLIVGQVAISVVLLSAAAVLLVTLVRLTSADLGFEVDDLTILRMRAAPRQLAEPVAIRAFEARALELVRSIPGVEAAASASSTPLERGWNIPIGVEAGDEQTGLTVELRAVSPGYFETLGVALLSGRSFAAADRTGAAPVALVNAALARRIGRRAEALRGAENAGEAGSPGAVELLGGTVAVGFLADEGAWIAPELEGRVHRVVGVVADVKEYGPEADARPTVYLPLAQMPAGLMSLPRLLVRSPRPSAIAAARDQLLELEAELRSVTILPMSRAASGAVAGQRFNAVLMAIFGGIALTLTLVGLYGLLAQAVGQRRQEIGVRMALGARPAVMLTTVLGQGVGLVLIGLVLGLGGSIAAGNMLASMVFEVSPNDPMVLGTVCAVFLAVALLACAIPARRATLIDPVEALRADL